MKLSQKKKRGVSLVVVLAIISIIALLALMMIQQGQIVRTLVLGEGQHFLELQTTLQAENALLEDVQKSNAKGSEPAGKTYEPTLGDVKASSTWKSGKAFFSITPRDYGSFDNLFPNYKSDHFTPGPIGEEKQTSAGYQWRYATPHVEGEAAVPLGHSLANLKVEKHRRRMLVDPNFPYSVYAPGGHVQLEELYSYNNPAFLKSKQKKEGEIEGPLFNGRPSRLFAQDYIEIEKVENGHLESVNGPILFQSGRALSRLLPQTNHSYLTVVEEQVKDLKAYYNTLHASDRTGLLKGRPLTVSGLIDLFQGNSDWYSFISMEQAMQIPFPPIPSKKDYGIGWVLCLHLPMPSDWTGFRDADETSKRVGQLTKDLAAAKKQRANAEKEYDKENQLYESLKKQYEEAKSKAKDPDADATVLALKKKVDKQKRILDKAARDLESAKTEFNRIQKELNDTVEEAKSHTENNTSHDFGPPPQTQKEEDEYFRRNGTFGWAWFRFISSILTNVESLIDVFIKGDTAHMPDSIADVFVYPCRVVHFAGRRPEFWSANTDLLRSDQLTFDRPGYAPLNYNSMKATWSIQPGKPVKLRGDWQIAGDLWIRRGGLLIVDGDLKLTRPLRWPAVDYADVGDNGIHFDYKEKEATGPMRPTGRIILEEGASLYVKGDLEVDGSEALGSVTLTARYGVPSMINRAIICDGDVVLNHGIQSGILMDELLGDLGDFGKKVYGELDQFLNRLTPFLSRVPVISPFAWRDSYFADYAFTIEVFPESEAVGLPPVVLPIPLPFENCLKDPFDYISMAYAIELGFNLGPEFMTHSLTWPWGNGVVPAMPKVDPEALEASVKDFKVPSSLINALDAKEIALTVLNALENFGETLLKSVLAEALNDIIGSELGLKCGSGKSGKTAKKEAKAVFKTIWANKTKILAWIKLGVRHYSIASEKAQEAWQNEMKDGIPLVKESAGLFLHAEGSISVGPGSASGWLVAKNDINVRSEIFVGTLMSRFGNVQAETVYAFPYFSYASIYKPAGFANTPAEMVQFEIPKATDGPTDIGKPVFTKTARWWEK